MPKCNCNCEPKCCTKENCDSSDCQCNKNKVVNYWQDEELKPKREKKTIEFEPEFDITIHQMNRKEIEETYQDIPLLFADGFDKAIVGVSRTFNKLSVCYDTNKCIKTLMTRDKMSREEALEYFEFNVAGAYVGEHTPSFIER